MNTTSRKLGVTNHAYDLIRLNITSQKGNMKQNIENAKRWGLEYNHKVITSGIKSFVQYVMRHYRKTASKPNYKQKYIIYGCNLYIYLILI